MPTEALRRCCCPRHPHQQPKLKKQMKYANARQVPFVVLIGKNEMESQKLALKDMRSGEQQFLPLDEIINILSNKEPVKVD